MSVLLALLVILVFAWALKAGQFDKIDREGERILFDEDQKPEPAPTERS
jgi:cbb3-type cytochrome oxidase maturation protein